MGATLDRGIPAGSGDVESYGAILGIEAAYVDLTAQIAYLDAISNGRGWCEICARDLPVASVGPYCPGCLPGFTEERERGGRMTSTVGGGGMETRRQIIAENVTGCVVYLYQCPRGAYDGPRAEAWAKELTEAKPLPSLLKPEGYGHSRE